MLVTPLFNGQGLGNQLANYVTTRCKALDYGYDFGVVFPERFKGYFFKNILLPKVEGFEFPVEGQPPILMQAGMTYYRETSSDYDNKIKYIHDNHCIHGNLQGEGYFGHRRAEIQEWLAVKPLKMPNDLCVINFRGGEYVGVTDFFLPQSYWDMAIKNMRKLNPKMKFEVHTDDTRTARQFFPDLNIISNIEINWRSIRYAKYLIISNSSFAFFPAWLNEDVKMIIAPKYWARYNKEYWDLQQNITKCFSYQNKKGELFSGETCLIESK